MNGVRARLIFVFVAATLAPLAATWWLTTSLLEWSWRQASTGELDQLSQSLEATGRAFFVTARDALRADVAAGRVEPVVLGGDPQAWPPEAREFAASSEKDRFVLPGPLRDRIHYYVRQGPRLLIYSRTLGISMRRLTEQHARARSIVAREGQRDLRRGSTITFLLLAAAVWCISLLALIGLSYRITSPVQQLTAALASLATGDTSVRLNPRGKDEVAAAMHAFNDMSEKLTASRDRLVAVTRLASWQTLARKMAHEVKNSLTPIRLTMEELMARRNGDPRFLEQAAQIVVEEVQTLERRVRAFSQFAAEPPVNLTTVDVNALLQERISFLRGAHPTVNYDLDLMREVHALADEDLCKGMLTNLIENAAQAVGTAGSVLCRTRIEGATSVIEIHDSGPGLSQQAKLTLFEPTISFKKAGMGLGLSIARKSALLLGGDITLMEGELGGAAFCIHLPAAQSTWQNESSSSMTRRTSAVPSA